MSLRLSTRNRPGSRRQDWVFSPGPGQFLILLIMLYIFTESMEHFWDTQKSTCHHPLCFSIFFSLIPARPKSQNGQIPVLAKIGSSRPKPQSRSVAAFHHTFNSLLTCQHPTIWKLLECLESQQNHIQDWQGKLLQSLRPSTQERQNERIQNLVASYTRDLIIH